MKYYVIDVRALRALEGEEPYVKSIRNTLRFEQWWVNTVFVRTAELPNARGDMVGAYAIYHSFMGPTPHLTEKGEVAEVFLMYDNLMKEIIIEYIMEPGIVKETPVIMDANTLIALIPIPVEQS